MSSPHRSQPRACSTAAAPSKGTRAPANRCPTSRGPHAYPGKAAGANSGVWGQIRWRFATASLMSEPCKPTSTSADTCCTRFALVDLVQAVLRADGHVMGSGYAVRWPDCHLYPDCILDRLERAELIGGPSECPHSNSAVSHGSTKTSASRRLPSSPRAPANTIGSVVALWRVSRSTSTTRKRSTLPAMITAMTARATHHPVSLISLRRSSGCASTRGCYMVRSDPRKRQVTALKLSLMKTQFGPSHVVCSHGAIPVCVARVPERNEPPHRAEARRAVLSLLPHRRPASSARWAWWYPPPMSETARQPCANCGAETAAGSRRFIGRKRAVDRKTGQEVILCPVCLSTSTVADDSSLPGAARYAVVEIRGMTS